MLGGCRGCTGPLTYDASPDAADGGPPCGHCTAGVTVGIAGNNAYLYAVSADAGVWRSGNSSEGALTASEWYQLPAGPPRAFSIAVDPNNQQHLAVGQRDGDQLANNNSGVRESTDAGETWPTYFDPAAPPLNCSEQGVSSVAFSRKSTLFFSTACGVGVRQSGQAISWPTLPTGTTPITAVTASETKLWARTAAGVVLVSTDEGVSWSLATQKPIPSNANNFTSQRGDRTSLGVWDNFVFMSSLGATRMINGVAANNYNQLTILDIAHDQWVVQSQILGSVNGTGAGGRRQVKSFIFGTSGKVGSDRQLYFSSAQEIYRADAQNSDGTLQWEQISASGSSGVLPTNGQFVNIIHNDLWDFNVANGGSDLWIASDGGIVQNTLVAKGWIARNQGLHTQHVHELYTPEPDLHLSSVTHDNDGWFRVSPGTWQTTAELGDATWLSGDPGNPVSALFARRNGACANHCSCGQLVQFGTTTLTPTCDLINQDGTFGGQSSLTDGPGSIIFIATLSSEGNPSPKLDALLLTRLPLTYDSGGGNTANVSSPLGDTSLRSYDDLVILRNPQYMDHPQIESAATDWSIFANNLPAGTHKFWVSGGHSNPSVFILATQTDGEHLYKLQKPMGPPHPFSSWQELNVQGSLQQPQPWPSSQILSGAFIGPVFVNPWNALQLYVLTASGVEYSADGGQSFNIDQTLTNLINGSGKFPMTGDFAGSTPESLAAIDFGNSYVSAHMGTLSAVSFNRDYPSERVAASPFTGLFYSRGDGNWTILGKAMPTPVTSISDVGIVGDQIYVATEGRGILNIRQFRNWLQRIITMFH
jgi:hypothetical protein